MKKNVAMKPACQTRVKMSRSWKNIRSSHIGPSREVYTGLTMVKSKLLVCVLNIISLQYLLYLYSYSFSPSGDYKMPPSMDYNSVLEHIRAFPMIAKPEVFGLHENADITKDNKEAGAVSITYIWHP